MTASIVTIQVGHCGAMLGNKFWEIVANEHGLDEKGGYYGTNDIQLRKIAVYFAQSSHGNYMPRSVMCDLESGTLETIRSGAMGAIFRPDNFITADSSASNNWAKGHYTEGAALSDTIMETVRKETEECDHLQGYQLMHSIGGGSGSGLGTLLMQKLQEEFPDRIIASFTVYPSPKVSEVVVEPYNAVLSIHHMLDNTDETFVLDNEALYNIAQRTLKLGQPSMADLNHVVSFALSGLTTCLRFPGQLNADLRKLAVNMVPFPRLHFFVPGYAPLFGAHEKRYKTLTVPELITQMLDPQNMMAACNTRQGKYLTAASVFRGHVSTRQVEAYLTEARERNSSSFCHWIPGNLSRAICDIAAPGEKLTSTFMGNTTALQDVMKRIMEQYRAMYKRKAFMHWYLGEGMEQAEFEEAEASANDMIAEYQLYESCT